MGKSKVTHDVLPEELNNLPHCDIEERYFYPYSGDFWAMRHLGPM